MAGHGVKLYNQLFLKDKPEQETKYYNSNCVCESECCSRSMIQTASSIARQEDVK